MIINNVIINNFFCFLDKNELSFKKGLNIVSSPNSGGKSQLFNALYWTFFDKIYIQNDNSTTKSWRSAQNLIICPDAISKNPDYNGKIKTFVEISLDAEHPDSLSDQNDLVNYTFHKSMTYEKNGSNLNVYSKPELTISYIEHGETKIISSILHNILLEKIFPESIRKFMWYQGETMDELYDFNQPHTLKYAIKEISYYPIYDNMEKIVKSSLHSIDLKIDKARRLSNTLTAEQGRLINEIREKKNNIKSKEETIDNYNERIRSINEDIATVEDKLRNSEKFSELKNQLYEKEFKYKSVVLKIENIESELKTKLVSKWMLAGCNKIIESVDDKLELINSEIQKFSKTTNPVPMSLPGPEYIDRMLVDKICYICEREVAEPSPAYDALKRRLDDFEKSANYKLLQENYTDLIKAKRNVLDQLVGIKEEIESSNKSKIELLKERVNANKEVQSILKQSGSDSQIIKDRGNTVDQNLNKHKVLRNEKESKSVTVKALDSEIYKLKEEVKALDIKLQSKTPTENQNFVENIAKDYIDLFDIVIETLNKEAYKKFITDLQIESNKLYSLYLGGKPQGEIIINEGIHVIDFKTKETLRDFNTAELVAQKLAVANSFLSLSENVKNKTYPIIADAPTSDFDSNNTINLTMNIGKSFDQMIILSKDYTSLSDKERDNLISKANISKYYEFNFDKINNDNNDDESNSRLNKKTFIKVIK
jgi:DNA sulfur modification protein DndD